MIRIETITIPAKKALTREVQIFVCDSCRYENQARSFFRTCVLCKRLACQVAKGCATYDPHADGDYPSTYCAVCYQLKFVKYDKDFQDIEKEYEDKQERLSDKILQESLETNK